MTYLDIDQDEVDDLRHQVRFERRVAARLAAHPNHQDPDFPLGDEDAPDPLSMLIGFVRCQLKLAERYIDQGRDLNARLALEDASTEILDVLERVKS